MTKHILICVHPQQRELIELIQEWSVENLNLKDKKIELVFAHCNEDLDMSLLAGPEVAYASEYLVELEEEKFTKFKESMEQLALEFNKKLNIQVESTILKGLDQPYKQLSKYAEEVGANLLIVGSRDLSFWQRVWSTSFSDSLLHEVHCPVIIIKPKIKDDKQA